MELALVLSGGGAKGAFEAGVLRAVQDAGLRPTILSGTSAGALNAAAYATGVPQDALESLWTRLTAADVFEVRKDVWRLPRPFELIHPGQSGGMADRILDSIGWSWMLGTDPLRDTIVDILDGDRVVPGDGMTLTVTAVEMLTGQQARFCSRPPPPHRSDPRFVPVDLTVEHLLASAAIPLLFPPIHIDGVAYWDGGLVANTPIGSALAFEPDAAIVVTTSALDRPTREPRTFGEAATLLFDGIQANALKRDCAFALTTNHLVEHAPESTDRRYVEFCLIEPIGEQLDMGAMLEFDPVQSARLIELGYEVAAPALDEFLGRL